MSHWNYRVLKTKVKEFDGTLEDQFAIHECYFDEENDLPHMWTDHPRSICGCETLEALKESFEWQRLAFDKPILEVYTNEKGEEKVKEIKV